MGDRSRLLVIIGATMALSAAAPAQQAPAESDRSVKPASTLRLVAGGVAGLAAASAIGVAFSDGCTEMCIGPAVAFLFTPFFVPAGIHRASRGQAPFSTVFWHSMGGLMAGGIIALGAYEMANDHGRIGIPVMLASQIAFGVLGVREAADTSRRSR